MKTITKKKKKPAYKKVNVYITRVISEINPPIKSDLKGVRMSVENIKKCLLANAKVEEVFIGGSTTELTIKNYDQILTPVKKVEIPKADPVELEEVVLDHNTEDIEEEVETKEELEAIIIGEDNTSKDTIEEGLVDEDGLDIIDIGTLL